MYEARLHIVWKNTLITININIGIYTLEVNPIRAPMFIHIKDQIKFTWQ